MYLVYQVNFLHHSFATVMLFWKKTDRHPHEYGRQEEN